jgi:hypothetical protein
MTKAGLWDAYELQRKAGPAVVDMKLRGLGFDQEEHRRQADHWSADLNTAQAAYIALTGRHPPENDEQLRDWLRSVLTTRQLETWTLTPTEHLLSVAGRDLKRLVGIESATRVLEDVAAVRDHNMRMRTSRGPRGLFARVRATARLPRRWRNRKGRAITPTQLKRRIDEWKAENAN